MFHFYYEFFVTLGLIIVLLGLSGILINRLNILISIICIEIVFYGINFSFISYSLSLKDILGQIISLFILTVAASESALALALIIMFFRVFNDILLEKI
jgi:NADH-quinone oxidoreductase subunit K